MQPADEYESVIARIVDGFAGGARLDPSVIDQIIARIDFAMTQSQGNFLIDYIRWRMENPIATSGETERAG